MLRTITTKCPCCKYERIMTQRIEIRIIPASNYTTCKPGRGPVTHNKPTKREEVVETRILEGDEKFIKCDVVTFYHPKQQKADTESFLCCPKCGVIFHSKITKIEEKEE